MEETAYAKINLALHVRAREADGYHRIETLFAFAEDGDLLRAEEADGLSLEITGPFAGALGNGPDNLVLRAAEALGAGRGAALTLDKRLPIASGIGGGSADAAAALRLLRRLWSLDVSDEALAGIGAGLGADVPACVYSRLLRGDGRGDRLVPAGEEWSATPLLLVNPGVAVPTGAVFRGWDGVDRGPLGDPLEGRNDLEGPALAIAPVIAEVLKALRDAPGVLLSRMSGSGATSFALFANEAARDAAADALRSAQPDWWQLATRLR